MPHDLSFHVPQSEPWHGLKRPAYEEYVCRCGQIVVAVEQPEPMRWDDGHVCYFVPAKSREGGDR